MNRIIRHIWNYIKCEQSEKLIPIYDKSKKFCSTSDMITWFTTKPCTLTKKSHISHIVCDSSWEDTESYRLEKNPHVKAWAKNDHLGFYVNYTFDGTILRYFPDFLIRLDNGIYLILEVKGQDKEKDKSKRIALNEWITAINGTGEFGHWASAISYSVKDIDGIIEGIINETR